MAEQSAFHALVTCFLYPPELRGIRTAFRRPHSLSSRLFSPSLTTSEAIAAVNAKACACGGLVRDPERLDAQHGGMTVLVYSTAKSFCEHHPETASKDQRTANAQIGESVYRRISGG